MTDADDKDDEALIVDAIDDAIIPDADAPRIIHARHLLDTVRARVIGKGVNRGLEGRLDATRQLAIRDLRQA